MSALPSAPDRPSAAHKGTFGTVVVVGGEAHMPGAPALAARGALRAGCGSVRVAAATAVLSLVLALERSVIGVPLPARGRGAVLRNLEADAIIVGCGWQAAGHEADLISLWKQPATLIIDGGGLRALASAWKRLGPRAKPTILTPHPGECAGLSTALGLREDPLDEQRRAAAAQEVAAATGAVVVLKGRGTRIAGGGRSDRNRSGGPALAIPGSGDVLAGIIGSLVAQGIDAYAAARLGTAVHGAAGDAWTADNGARGMLAAELADLVPRAFATLARRS